MPPLWNYPFSGPISSCPPSFSSSNVREAASNGARLQRVHVAGVRVFFYSSEISLQLSIIHTQRATHLTRAHARTRTSVCSLYTSGCGCVRLYVCVCVCVFSSLRCRLIESSIVSNDPSPILLFYPDQRAKSCCEDENEGLSLSLTQWNEEKLQLNEWFFTRCVVPKYTSSIFLCWYVHFYIPLFDFYL